MSLTPVTSPIVNDNVVEILKDALVRAERGEITGVFIVEMSATTADHYCAGINDRWRTLGVIYHAAHKLHEM